MSVDFNEMFGIFSDFSNDKKACSGQDINLNDLGEITKLFANSINNDLQSFSEKELLDKIAEDVFRNDFDDMLDLDRPEFNNYEDLLAYTQNRGQSLYYSRNATVFSFLEKETFDSYPIEFKKDNLQILSPTFSGNHDEIESEIKLNLFK